MKSKFILLAWFLVLASLSISQLVNAQPTQLSTTVTLTYLNVQLTYPSEVLPGQTTTVSVQATAKDSFHLNKLVVQVYYADGNALHALAAVAIANNTSLNSGEQVTGNIQFTVPLAAPRTSIVALVSEIFRVPYYSYSSLYYPYSYLYFPSGNPSRPYFFYVYPPTNMAAADDSIATLSYVKATTPEYVTLQSEYQALQQQLAQSQSDNHKLQQNLQTTQTTLAQADSIITGLNQQLSSTQTQLETFEAISAILVAIAVILGFLLFKQRRKPEQTVK